LYQNILCLRNNIAANKEYNFAKSHTMYEMM